MTTAPRSRCQTHIFESITFFFFIFLRPIKIIYSYVDLSQSLDGAKTGDPREKPPATFRSHVRQANLTCLTCDLS